MKQLIKFLAVSILFLLLITIATFAYIKRNNLTLSEFGLGVLIWVQDARGDAVDWQAIYQKHTPTMTHHDWDTLLQQHVSTTGQVDYQDFIADSTRLNKYLNDLSRHVPSNNWSEPEQLAYWINAYNAFTVKLIMDHYPVKSIKDIADGLPMIASPWDIKFFKIGNVDFDLNTIEHKILRAKFKEPRIHFAINCASVSCPKLRAEAYSAAQLEAQLEAQTMDFLNHPTKNIINHEVTQLSQIFDWFRGDFVECGGVFKFIQKYNHNIREGNKVELLKYDWKLNEHPPL